jgi:predicted permease
METLIQNLRYAARQVRRAPGFAAVVVVTIAVGVGATTTIFSLVNAVLLRPLPVEEPDRLVGMVEVLEQGGRPYVQTYPNFQRLREAAPPVLRLGAHGMSEVALQGRDEARVILAGFVSGDFFHLIGVAPVRGRMFDAADEVPGAPEAVAIVSHRLWQGELGGDPDVVGSTLRLNSQPVTVVGVAPAEFGGLERGVATDVWLPIPTYALLRPGSNIDHPTQSWWLVTFGRLEAGYEAPAAEAVLSGVVRAIDEERTNPRGVVGVEVFPLTGLIPEMATPLRLFLALLLSASALVLLIACVNVAGMLLARAATRRRELGVRLALGAGRRRLVGQLLTETTVLFVMGGLGGVLLAAWAGRLFSVASGRLPGELSLLSLDVATDWRVVGFGLAAALVTALLFGLAPALRASRPAVVSFLKDGAGATARRSRLRGAFVAGQVAVCTILLVGAGLLARALQEALAVDLGMDPRGVVVASLDISPHGYDEERGRIFFRELRDRLSARPGVESVALANHVPLTFTEIVYSVAVPGHKPPGGGQTFSVDANVVGEDYFSTLRIPLEGRGFTAADGEAATRVAVINRTMATRFWPDGDAVGRSISLGSQDVEIVGIAADGKYNRVSEEPMPYIYLPFEQEYSGGMVVHVRSGRALPAVAALIQGEVAALDRGVPVVEPASLDQAVRLTLLPQRVAAAAVGFLGALGLLLAAVGLYGLLAYQVAQRTREMGVRMALGARPADVARLVVVHAGALVGLGLAAGLFVALGTTRALSALLMGISPTDPLTFAAVVLLLAMTGLLAAWGPARRAMRVDPMTTLKSD